eukprot:858815-Lingulodinium_polyedra.AAC.1
MATFVRIAVPARPTAAARQAVGVNISFMYDGLDETRDVPPPKLIAEGSRSVVDGEDEEPVAIPPSKKE